MRNRLITVVILLGHVLALFLAVSPAPRVLALGVLAVASLGILVRLRRRLRRPHSRVLGAYAPARIVAVATVMVSLGRTTTSGWVLLALLASAVLIPLISLEGSLGRVWRAGTRMVVNLPGPDFDSTARRLGGVMLPAGMLVLLVAALSVWVPALSLLAFALVLLIGTVALVWTYRARRRAPGLTDAVTRALEAYGARVMIYVSGPPGTEYQFGVWAHQFEALDEPAVVITREASLARRIGARTHLPVVSASRLPHLEAVHQCPFRVSLYVNNGMKNSHNVRYSDLTHVQLLHGDSDKPSSYNPVTAMFDKVFVAGQAGIDRYAAHGVEIPRDKFVIVGRPQVGDITSASEAAGDGRTVLYGPTWTGFNTDNNFGSLAHGPAIVRELLARRWTVIFRPHPFSAKEPGEAAKILEIEDLLRADSSRSGRRHVHGSEASATMSIVDCFNASDALVADISSVPADYLYSEKPFVITKVDDSAMEDYVAAFPLASAAVVMDVFSPSGIEDAVARLDDDALAARRHAMSTYYLGDIPREEYADAFPAAVSALVRANPGPDEVTSASRESQVATGAVAPVDDAEPHGRPVPDDVGQHTPPGPEAGL